MWPQSEAPWLEAIYRDSEDRLSSSHVCDVTKLVNTEVGTSFYRSHSFPLSIQQPPLIAFSPATAFPPGPSPPAPRCREETSTCTRTCVAMASHWSPSAEAGSCTRTASSCVLKAPASSVPCDPSQTLSTRNWSREKRYGEGEGRIHVGRG